MKSPHLPSAPKVARPPRLGHAGLAAMLLVTAFHVGAQNMPASSPASDGSNLFAAPVARMASVELERVQKFDTLATDRSVSRLLDRWARQSGVGFVWDAKSDITLSTQDRFIGTIEQATERLISGVAGVTLQACIYNNNPPVIRITESGTPCE